jgi:hypothetical protein
MIVEILGCQSTRRRDNGEPGGEMTTKRTGARTIETTFSGRVTADMIVHAAAGYRELGGRSVWVIAAEETKSYAPEAVERAVTEFRELNTKHGMDLIIAIITAPLVRMGASVVAATLRSVGSPLVIRVVGSRGEVAAALVA